MMLKREGAGSQPSFRKWVRRGLAVLGAASASLALASGCLDRPVVPQDPNTSNIYIAEIRQTAVDKIDLLFMIDNSISMQDKQQILKQAVPVLVQRLVTPICIDANREPIPGLNTDANGKCANGEPEFTPIKDIHIAIVTSSLGGHGGEICSMTGSTPVDPSVNDQALPLGLVRTNLQQNASTSYWSNTGFLAWDPDAAVPQRARNTPPGVSDQALFQTQFENMVAEVGEVGCGFEASLEAWYRFLIDPHPPSEVKRSADGNVTEAIYPNNQLLSLRSQFLRRDSLVAIIMLTDENDCSIRDEGQAWLVGTTVHDGRAFKMPRATSICTADPNNECCVSCAQTGVPAGCPALKDDPNCQAPPFTGSEDHVNLRCYAQQARFGIDYLYPIQRYVDALTLPTVVGRDGKQYTNPLFDGVSRDQSLVFLAGIVGVPWQDVSTEESWPADAPLEYLTFEELQKAKRFDWMLGPDGGVPQDPLMFETSADRSTLGFLNKMHPATKQPIAPASMGPGPGPNAINGKEMTIKDGSDLQYACIFPLSTPKANCSDTDTNCDCTPADAPFNRPLCNGNTQTHAKAYPGVRHLQVLKSFGELTKNAIVASICPKFIDPARGTSYGYSPAVASIIDRLKEALRGKCLPRKLAPCTCDPVADPTCGEKPGDRICARGFVPGQVPCAVIEARLPDEGQTSCPPCTGTAADPGRYETPEEIYDAVNSQLEDNGYCGGSRASCDTFCRCAIRQFDGQELEACRTTVTSANNTHGFCYVDPTASGLTPQQSQAAATIVASCPNTQRRLLQFTGDNVPAKGSIALIACLGGNVQEIDLAGQN